ncbi:hypothetical protein HID58_069277, partial [Brassica napus]
ILKAFRTGPHKQRARSQQTAHIQSTPRVTPEDRVRCCIKDYEFLHDVHRYLRVVRQRIGLHTSTKGLVPPEEGMKIIAVFTRLLPSTELFHPRVRAYSCDIRIQEICGYAPPSSCSRKTYLAYHCNANPRSRIPTSERGNISLQQISTDTSDLHQPNLGVLPSIDMQGQDPESP